MNIEELRKLVVSGGAISDQFGAFMRDSLETIPLDVMVVAWDDAYTKTVASVSQALNGGRTERERITNLLDAMRNISHMLTLAGEVQRRANAKIAAAEGDAQ